MNPAIGDYIRRRACLYDTGGIAVADRGVWAAGTAYALNDAVVYGGYRKWRALRSSTGVVPVEGLDWAECTDISDQYPEPWVFVVDDGTVAPFDAPTDPLPAGEPALLPNERIQRCIADGTTVWRAHPLGLSGLATPDQSIAVGTGGGALVPTTLTLTPPTFSIAVAGTQLLTATVYDQLGAPLPGATVHFASSDGDITVPAGDVVTDGSGVATKLATGAVAGTATITANAVGFAGVQDTSDGTVTAGDPWQALVDDAFGGNAGVAGLYTADTAGLPAAGNPLTPWPEHRGAGFGGDLSLVAGGTAPVMGVDAGLPVVTFAGAGALEAAVSATYAPATIKAVILIGSLEAAAPGGQGFPAAVVGAGTDELALWVTDTDTLGHHFQGGNHNVVMGVAPSTTRRLAYVTVSAAGTEFRGAIPDHALQVYGVAVSPMTDATGVANVGGALPGFPGSFSTGKVRGVIFSRVEVDATLLAKLRTFAFGATGGATAAT